MGNDADMMPKQVSPHSDAGGPRWSFWMRAEGDGPKEPFEFVVDSFQRYGSHRAKDAEDCLWTLHGTPVCFLGELGGANDFSIVGVEGGTAMLDRVGFEEMVCRLEVLVPQPTLDVLLGMVDEREERGAAPSPRGVGGKAHPRLRMSALHRIEAQLGEMAELMKRGRIGAAGSTWYGDRPAFPRDGDVWVRADADEIYMFRGGEFVPHQSRDDFKSKEFVHIAAFRSGADVPGLLPKDPNSWSEGFPANYGKEMPYIYRGCVKDGCVADVELFAERSERCDG